MAVPHELSCFLLGTGKSHPLYDVINTPFKKLQKIFTSDSLHSFGFFEIPSELSFKYTIHPPNFLLLPKLQAVFRLFYSRLPMLPRGITPPGDTAFIRITTLGLQKELHTLSPAELTN
jgi:hypothetical protein